MAKDPAVLFYTADFLAGTIFMRNDQVGKYIKLLCMQHQQGHLKEEDMLEMCGSYDERIFSKFAKDEEGLYYNVRMEEETLKRKKYSESRSNNRKGNKNQHMNGHMSKDMYDDMSTHMCKHIEEHMTPHMENENENINNNIYNNSDNIVINENIVIKTVKDTTEIDEMFDVFWKAYPKKSNKKGAKVSFKRIKNLKTEFPLIMEALERFKKSKQWTKQNGEFIPLPTSWINQERWKDEHIETREDKLKRLDMSDWL